MALPEVNEQSPSSALGWGCVWDSGFLQTFWPGASVPLWEAGRVSQDPGPLKVCPQCRRGTWRAAPSASTEARSSPQAWDDSDPQGSKARFAPNTT